MSPDREQKFVGFLMLIVGWPTFIYAVCRAWGCDWIIGALTVFGWVMLGIGSALRK